MGISLTPVGQKHKITLNLYQSAGLKHLSVLKYTLIFYFLIFAVFSAVKATKRVRKCYFSRCFLLFYSAFENSSLFSRLFSTFFSIPSSFKAQIWSFLCSCLKPCRRFMAPLVLWHSQVNFFLKDFKLTSICCQGTEFFRKICHSESVGTISEGSICPLTATAIITAPVLTSSPL